MRSRTSLSLIGLLLLAACEGDQRETSPLAPVPAPPPSIVTYTPRFLGAVPNYPSSVARSINDAGVVAGWASASNQNDVPVVWNSAGLPTVLSYFYLPTYGPRAGQATSINNNGMAVGWLALPVSISPPPPVGPQPVAVYWPTPTSGPVSIGPFGSLSAATDVNASGVVTGYMWTLNSTTTTAFTWTPGVGLTVLPGLPGQVASVAWAIDDGGQVVGWAEMSDGCTKPVRWDHAPAGLAVVPMLQALTDCGMALDVTSGRDPVGSMRSGTGLMFAASFGASGAAAVPGWAPPPSRAEAVSPLGRVVGYSSSNSVKAYTTDPAGNLSQLPPPGASQGSRAWGVNRCGQIVGAQLDYAPSGLMHAVLWDGYNGDCRIRRPFQ